MSQRAPVWGKLTDLDYRLIDVVVGHVQQFGEIPTTGSIAEMMGLTRQRIVVIMDNAAERGILRRRPKYAIRWFELTPLGEDLYRERRVREPAKSEGRD